MKFEVEVDVEAEVAARVEGLEKALTLTTNSREWNRKRVLELEDKLERIDRGHVCTGSCKPNAHVAFAGRQRIEELEKALAESRALVEFKNRVADEADRDKDELFRKLQEEREKAETFRRQAYQENDRAAVLTRQMKELEAQNQRLIDNANLTERTVAASLAEHRQSIAARDALLTAATRRVKAATEYLAAPKVEKARDEIVTSKGAVLADAIGNALRVLNA